VLVSATAGSLTLYLFSNCRLAVVVGRLFPNSLTCSRHWLVAIGAGTLMILSLSSPLCRSILAWPPIHFLGEISYSLYLWHFIVMLYCVHLLYGRVPLCVILCLVFGFTIVVSRLSYLWVEVPGIDLGRQLSNAFQRRVGSGAESSESTALSTSSQ